MSYLNVPDSYKEILGMTADEYAKKQTAGLDETTQKYLDEYEKAAEQRKNALNTNKQNVIEQYANQKVTVDEDAKNQSRQAYINSMITNRDIGQKLSQAGLSTTGVVGSTYSDLANAYSENLNTINSNKSKAIRDIDNNISSTEKEFSAKEQQLLSDIETAKIDMKRYNNELANTRYQEAINNYMQYKSIEQYVNNYNQQENSLQAAERQRQYENSLAEREYALKKRQVEAELENYKKTLELSNQQKNISSEPNFSNINMDSVIKLGYGPISKTKLNELVNRGDIIAKAVNGQIIYEKPESTNINTKKLQMWNRY